MINRYDFSDHRIPIFRCHIKNLWPQFWLIRWRPEISAFDWCAEMQSTYIETIWKNDRSLFVLHIRSYMHNHVHNHVLPYQFFNMINLVFFFYLFQLDSRVFFIYDSEFFFIYFNLIRKNSKFRKKFFFSEFRVTVDFARENFNKSKTHDI